MKILLISDTFPPESFGGAGRIVYNLFNGFKNAGCKVFVFTATQNKTNTENEEPGICRIYLPQYNERWKTYSSLYNRRAAKEAKKMIQLIKPDVIHIHNVHTYLSYAIFKVAKKHCSKVFLTAHDVMLFHYGKLLEFIDKKNPLQTHPNVNYKISPWQQLKRYQKRYNPFRNMVIRHYLKYVDKIFAVSYALKNALEDNDIKNIDVIYNGIDINDWKCDSNEIRVFKDKFNLPDKKIIFYGGRISTLKGAWLLLDALKEVKKSLPNVLLLVAGKKDEYAERLIKEVAKNNISMIITGWLSSEDMKTAYANSDLVVVPSAYLDPFPTINLEAMACQKPVVGTCFGGTPEVVVDNKTGYIINPFNTKMVAEKIIDLLKNPQKARGLGEAGYQRVKENFSLDKQIKETINFYQKKYD